MNPEEKNVFVISIFLDINFGSSNLGLLHAKQLLKHEMSINLKNLFLVIEKHIEMRSVGKEIKIVQNNSLFKDIRMIQSIFFLYSSHWHEKLRIAFKTEKIQIAIFNASPSLAGFLCSWIFNWTFVFDEDSLLSIQRILKQRYSVWNRRECI